MLTARDYRFSASSLTTDAGTVAVTVTNDDTTRHTFTIDELGVNLDVPPGTTQARHVPRRALRVPGGVLDQELGDRP